MMTTQQKWLLIVGVVAAAAVALALGVSPGTLVLVGISLLCPAVMFFGMGGMQHGGGHGGGRKPEEHDFKRAA